MTGEKLTRVVDLLPYVRGFWFYELASEDRIRSLRVIQRPWRRGGFHAVRAVVTYFLAMGMLGFGLLAYAKGSYGSAVIGIAIAFLMALGNLLVAANQSVLVLTADTLTLPREPLLWWSHRRFGLEDPITVRAQTSHGEGESFYFLEVIVGLNLARWGDFASLDDAARVAAFVGREVDVRQGRAPTMPESSIDAGSSQENAPGDVVASVPRGSSGSAFRLDAWDVVLFSVALIGGPIVATVLGANVGIAAALGMTLGLASLRVRRHFVPIPDLTREEQAFTQPGRRFASLMLIASGATLVILGGLVTVFAIIIVVTSRELRYPLFVIVPLCLTVLGAVLVRYGIRARPRV